MAYRMKLFLKKIKRFFRLKKTKATSVNQYYSQEGEDLILKRLFNAKKEGFYVDVGAHHPTRFSNTYLFYKMGWRGVNIDAMPGSMQAFNRSRPRDINIESPIADTEEQLVYYIFNEPALNTLSKIEAEKKDGLRNYKVIEEKVVTTRTLTSILAECINPKQDIDFLSVDVEGYDLKVLQSLDWSIYKPKVVLVEELFRGSLKELLNGDTTKFLESKGYQLFAKTFNTLFFIDNSWNRN